MIMSNEKVILITSAPRCDGYNGVIAIGNAGANRAVVRQGQSNRFCLTDSDGLGRRVVLSFLRTTNPARRRFLDEDGGTMKRSYSTRLERFAYQSGYRAGYNGKPDRSDLRGKDAVDAYKQGYADGGIDKVKRLAQRAAAA